MELFLEGLFACFNHSESLRHSKRISVPGYQVKMRERTFTKGKQPLDIEEKYFENTLCLEIVNINLMSLI